MSRYHNLGGAVATDTNHFWSINAAVVKGQLIEMNLAMS